VRAEAEGVLRDNPLAAEAAGAAFLTLHPRTKVQGYQGCVLRRRVGARVRARGL
jgi:tRNA-dihydrouridine synthase